MYLAVHFCLDACMFEHGRVSKWQAQRKNETNHQGLNRNFKCFRKNDQAVD